VKKKPGRCVVCGAETEKRTDSRGEKSQHRQWRYKDSSIERHAKSLSAGLRGGGALSLHQVEGKKRELILLPVSEKQGSVIYNESEPRNDSLRGEEESSICSKKTYSKDKNGTDKSNAVGEVGRTSGRCF